MGPSTLCGSYEAASPFGQVFSEVLRAPNSRAVDVDVLCVYLKINSTVFVQGFYGGVEAFRIVEVPRVV